jgi:hypothetical protein
MTGATRLVLVVVLTLAAIPPSTPEAAAARPRDGSTVVSPAVDESPRPAVVASAIIPGSVGRTSLFLDATYDAYLRLAWGTRAISVSSVATIRNTSGASIDRVELNTIAARLGGMRLRLVTVDGHAVAATVSDQTIVVPLGGILPAGATTAIRVSYGASLKTGLSGSDWLFSKANGVADLYRWLPWVSRRIAFDRPNHGDPFETPSSRAVRVRIVTDRKLVLATTGDRSSVSADGLTQVFDATDVRDFTVTAATEYRTGCRKVGATTVRVWYRPGAPGTAMLDAAADAFAALSARLGAYPHPVYKVVQSAGGYGMESPGLTWIPTGVGTSNLRYLAAHETAHQWFYGIVGNDQSRQPFADEAAADMVARYVLSLRRASRCSTTTLDRTIYQYTASCYYEAIYIQGGNLLDTARQRMGSSAYWTAVRGYIAAHRNGIATTQSLLQALDAGTPLNLGTTLFAARFPSIY